MKRLICMTIALTLACLTAAGLAETTGSSFLGRWVCGRAILEIVDEHPGYCATIHWGGSAETAGEWEYYCPYQLVDGNLVSEPTGVRRDVTYGEGGEIADSVTIYEDGTATFSLDDSGRLLWSDSKQDAGADMAFEPAPMIGFAPTAEELGVAYFGMIGDAALSLDKKACEALSFAASCEMWLADGDALRANMLDAWDGMDADEQTAFDESFMDVVRLLDACFEDWPANREAFEDGRRERMEALLAEPLYRAAWQTLCGSTLTLGNSED